MKILVIQQKMIGDVLLSTLICKNLKLWNSKITVDFIANRHTLDVIRHNPYIDEIVVFEDDFKKNKWGLFKFLLNQRNKKYDYIIDCYGKLESLLICAFTPAKKKIGFKKINTLLVYNHSIQRKTKQDSALQLSTVNRFQLLEPIMGDAQKNSEVEIFLSDEEKLSSRKKMDQVIGKEKKAIMISAMGSSDIKTYPSEYLARLIEVTYKTTQLPIILNYRPDQEDKILDLMDHLAPSTKNAIAKKLTPSSLRDFMKTVYHCVAILGNEGGAINMAKSLKIPTFAIFSPIIDPAGWHIEVPNKHMAVHLKNYFPDRIDFKNYKELQKNPKKVSEFYHLLNPNLFEKEWISFLISNGNQ